MLHNFFELVPQIAKKKLLWPLFLWMRLNYLKASATSSRQFTFYH